MKTFSFLPPSRIFGLNFFWFGQVFRLRASFYKSLTYSPAFPVVTTSGFLRLSFPSRLRGSGRITSAVHSSSLTSSHHKIKYSIFKLFVMPPLFQVLTFISYFTDHLQYAVPIKCLKLEIGSEVTSALIFPIAGNLVHYLPLIFREVFEGEGFLAGHIQLHELKIKFPDFLQSFFIVVNRIQQFT